MLLQKLYVVKLFFSLQILCLFCGLKNVSGAASQSVETLLSSLVHGNKKPTVVYVNTNNKAPQHSHIHGNRHQDHIDFHSHLHNELDEESAEKAAGAASTYWLDYLLRSTTDLRNNQPVDNQVADALRNALRSQCKILDKCVSKCVTGKVKCKITCKIVFDDGGKCKPKRKPTTTTPRDECADTDECARKK